MTCGWNVEKSESRKGLQAFEHLKSTKENHGGIPCIGFLIAGETHINATESGWPLDTLLERRSLACRHLLGSSVLLPTRLLIFRSGLYGCMVKAGFCSSNFAHRVRDKSCI